MFIIKRNLQYALLSVSQSVSAVIKRHAAALALARPVQAVCRRRVTPFAKEVAQRLEVVEQGGLLTLFGDRVGLRQERATDRSHCIKFHTDTSAVPTLVCLLAGTCGACDAAMK